MQNSDEDQFDEKETKGARSIYKTVLDWLGIYEDGEGPQFLSYPDDVQLALSDQELADEINLHVELAEGWCTCGLELQFAGIPLQAQAGHTWQGDPVSIFMFDTPDGIKTQCQDCLFEWPTFSYKCEHGERHDEAHCNYCMYRIVERASKKFCYGHSGEIKKPSIYKQISERSSHGLLVYLAVSFGALGLQILAIDGLAPRVFMNMPKIWILTALAGVAIWLFSIYVDEDKKRSARLKARAVGTWYWAAFALITPWFFSEIETVWLATLDVLGFS